jgi:hypothetical protein
MPTPTTAQLGTAIEVLNKLAERLDTHAAHSVMQLPETPLGDDYAAKVAARNIEQTSQIETVKAQLKIGARSYSNSSAIHLLPCLISNTLYP